jgi:hypothetical protein
MSILQITASQDNTITNAFLPDTITRAEYSNMGAADSLEVFSLYYSSSSGLEPQKSRILVKFPLDQIVKARQQGTLPNSGGVNFYLRLFNVEHPYTVPTNFSLIVMPISCSWDEGRGLDMESYSDYGSKGTSGYGSNWQFSTMDTWVANGGDYIEEYAVSQSFDAGTEDLQLDVTDIVEAQLAGTIPSEGFGVMLSSSYENPTTTEDYYTKKFSARSSEYFFKTPKLEARWESVLKDDRGAYRPLKSGMALSDAKNYIYVYNKVNGLLKDAYFATGTIPQVKLYSDTERTSEIQTISGSTAVTKVSTGVYRYEFVTTASLEEIYDYWYEPTTTGSIFASGTVELAQQEDSFYIEQAEYKFSITNLKPVYSTKERSTFIIYSRPKGWYPNIYTVASTDIENFAHKNLYYKVSRIVDNYTVIDYGIEPIAYTKCSYDKNGNYFSLDMNIFEPGYAYVIKLMLLEGSNYKECAETFRFKVE